MPDFGIGEAIAAASLFAGESAAVGGAELGAGALAEGALGGAAAGGAAGGGLGAAELGTAAALGDGAASAFESGLPGVLEGGGANIFGPLEGGGPGLSPFASAAPTSGQALPAGASAFDVGGGNAAFAANPEAAGSLTNPASYGNISGGSTGSGSVFDQLVGSTGKALVNNPLQAAGIGIGGAALGYNVLTGNKTSAEQKTLSGNAVALNAQGAQMAQYLQSGTLPPGLAAQRDRDNAAAKARAVQNAAHNGQSTDPTQNTALAADLNAIDQTSAIETAKVGQLLLTTGLKEIEMSDDLWTKLISLDRQASATTGQAIANFAAALSGGRAPQQQQRQA